MYRRASKKQLAYIASLCEQLQITNPTLYSKYSLENATKLIKKLRRKVSAGHEADRQLKLL